MPSKEWNNDLTLLTVAVLSKIRGGALPPPSWVEKNIQSHQTGWHAWYWYLVLSTASSSGGIHPGAVIGIDTFLQAVCKETLIPSNVGPIQQYHGLICTGLWTAYRLSEYLASKVHEELNSTVCSSVFVCLYCCVGIQPVIQLVCSSCFALLC